MRMYAIHTFDACDDAVDGFLLCVYECRLKCSANQCIRLQREVYETQCDNNNNNNSKNDNNDDDDNNNNINERTRWHHETST
mmetsp:Transcript_40860/g.79567  ORF Transcript_40860/g.79567 Transcript_40860/m.79567 type:complete len:82 (+) Transcript_40860:439-684(+)